MNEEALEQPRCPCCSTVMRDDVRGLRCGGCGHTEDHSVGMAHVVIPPEFVGPDVHDR